MAQTPNSNRTRLDAICQLLSEHHVDAYLVPSSDAHLNEYLPAYQRRRQAISGFAGSAGRVESPVRRLSRASFEQPSATEAWFTFTADGFLNHMVRNLVGTLLEVGSAKRSVEGLQALMEARDRTQAGPTAPAHALTLLFVRYPPEVAAAGAAPLGE